MNDLRHTLTRSLLATTLLLTTLVLVACNQQQQEAREHSGPTRVWFVSNDAPGPAFTGDLEAPFAVLADAEAASRPGDTIFLFAGDGSSRNQDRGITLKTGQQLIGEGLGLESAGIEPGAQPVLTNLNGPAIVVAPDNTISGLRIEAPLGAGILGTGVETLSLQNLTIADAGGDGVRLKASGSASMTVTATDLSVSGSAEAGLWLTAQGAAGVHLDLASSRLERNLGNAVQVDYLGSAGGHFDIGDITISTLGASGIRVVSTGPASQLIEGRITRVHVASHDPGTAGNGIAIIIEGDATALVEVLDNTVTQFGSYGIDLGSRGGVGVLEATVLGNSVTDPAFNALAGMRLASGNGAVNESNVLCLNLSENQSTEGSVPGYLQRQRPGTSYQLHGFAGAGTSQAAIAGFVTARNAGSLALGVAGSVPAFTGADCRRPDL